MNLFSIYISDFYKIINSIYYLKKILKLFIFISLLVEIKKIIKVLNIHKNFNQSISFYKYNDSYFFNQTNVSFNSIFINYTINYKYNITKIEYLIEFYDSEKRMIKPSDLTLYYKLHVFCHITKLKNNISIVSIPNIIKNKFYNCIEYLQFKERIEIGIKIYRGIKNPKFFLINLYNENLINYNYYYKNKYFFELSFYLKDLFQLKKKINKLNKFYYIFPNMVIKTSPKYKNSIWYYKNIYNSYFCFCKYSNNSNCSPESIPKNCKYLFYLFIIDNNKFIYNKTDYLFADFYSLNASPGEAYLIFEEMLKQNYNVHFMTRRSDIYKKYSNYNNNTPIIYNKIYIDGDFIENYLDLFLRLKATISGALIYSLNNIFYNIEYITYICIGHGISYLKDFLYRNYYGKNRYNKILLPPSYMIINNAKKFGWTDDNIIKIGLPRWDILVNYKRNNNSIYNIKYNKSIFIMFTWRKLKNKNNISQSYFKNIYKLLNNNDLNLLLKKKKIHIYFSLHHKMLKFQKLLSLKSKFIKLITQNLIIECLKTSSLLITDFSSIVFDFIAQNKPYIIYIPDWEDPNISKYYNQDYYDIINRMRNNSIYFENKYFSLKNVTNKIISYIRNDFKLDKKLKNFYEYANLKGGNNIQKFIEYLKYLK